jgi:hypothetical protein
MINMRREELNDFLKKTRMRRSNTGTDGPELETKKFTREEVPSPKPT